MLVYDASVMSTNAPFFSASISSRVCSGRSFPKRMPRARSTFGTASLGTRVIGAPALMASSRRATAGPGTKSG
nr:hypothetical protein [Cryobacterium breve]